MEIDEKLKGVYDGGKMQCDLCERVLDEGEAVDTIQEGMFIENCFEDTMVQYGEEHVTTILCKNCSPKVKVTVEG